MTAPSQEWLNAAYGALMAGTSGQYQPTLVVDFPEDLLTLTTRDWAFGDAGAALPLLARLEAGGVGTITRDLDELSDVLRVGGASFTLLNLDHATIQYLTTAPPLLAATPVVISVGFAGEALNSMAELVPITDVVPIFRGVVDRWEVTRETLVVSCVPDTRRAQRPITLTVREVAYWNGGASWFPDLPLDAGDTAVSLALGSATSVPLIRVGRNTYLSGFGVTFFSAIRDNDEEVLDHGDRPLFLVYTLSIRGQQLLVVKMRYAVDEGHIISMDINHGTALGTAGVWDPSAVQPYEFTPRPRVNLFANGSFEAGNDFATTSSSGAVVELATFPAGAGKVHEGYTSLRARSEHTTEAALTYEGVLQEDGVTVVITPVLPDVIEHRYTAELSATVTQAGSTAFHLSFWYIAGTFLPAGRPLTEQVSSQLSIKVNDLPWQQLPGSPGFDAMAQYTADIVALGGSVTVLLRCEGLTQAHSVDIYLDDFVCTGDDPSLPFSDLGVAPVTALRTLFDDWLPDEDRNDGTFSSVASARSGWMITSILGSAPDVLALLQQIATQIDAVLYKAPDGLWQLLASNAVLAYGLVFDEDTIVTGSAQRLAAPNDAIYSGVVVPYQQNGIVYLNSEGDNLEMDTSALRAEAGDRAALLGGEHLLQVDASLLLDRATAMKRLFLAFARHGVQGDLVTWRTGLHALTTILMERVTVTHPVLPGENLVELVGWHFLPNLMQVELVGRALHAAPGVGGVGAPPVAHPVSLRTDAGVPVGVSLPRNTTPAPGTTLDLDSILITALDPSGAGGFALAPTGTVVFSPAPLFTGLATALWSIADTDATRSNTATIAITVGRLVQLVVANADTVGTAVNTPVTFSVSDNDVAVATGALDLASVDLDPATDERQITWTDTGHGTFDADDAGNVTLTPVTDYTGPAMATYTIADDRGNVSAPATLTVLVGVEPPVATDIILVVPEDETGSVLSPLLLIDLPAAVTPFTGTTLDLGSVDLNPSTGGRQTSFTDTTHDSGTFSVNDTTGEVTLAWSGDGGAPAVCQYTIRDSLGALSNTATITTLSIPTLDLAISSDETSKTWALVDLLAGAISPPADDPSVYDLDTFDMPTLSFPALGMTFTVTPGTGGQIDLASPSAIVGTAESTYTLLDTTSGLTRTGKVLLSVS